MKEFCFLGLTEAQKRGILELGYCSIEDASRVWVTQGETCRLERKAEGIHLTYTAPNLFYRLLSMLSDFSRGTEAEYREQGEYGLLCYMADQSRNAVLNMKSAKQLIRILALCGYNAFMLYTEDTYEVPEYPYFGYMRGRFSKAELKELDAYAALFGIELIPCIQTLAHLESALQWECFAAIKDTPDAMMVDEDATYALIDAMLSTCEECFSSHRINVGLDEALMLGRGNYLKKNGYHAGSELMQRHMARVSELCRKHGFSMYMWSDMFFRMAYNGWYHECTEPLPQEYADLAPAGVTPVYWDYGNTDEARFRNMAKSHRRFSAEPVFAGGAGKWHGYAPGNRASVEVLKMQLSLCREAGISNIILTGWGDNGAEAAQFSILPTLLYTAESAYCQQPERAWLNQRAMQCFDLSYDELLLLDLPNDMGKGVIGERQFLNPCKYLLLNDPLMGLMDKNLIPEKVSACYAEHASTLQPLCQHPQWGYLFYSAYRLCDLLAVKAELSAQIRAAYGAKDQQKLRQLAEREIPTVIERLDSYLEAYEAQWLRENRAFGFEVQQERLGGLRMRLAYAARRIQAYLCKEIDAIDELEEVQLPFRACDPEHPYFRLWDTYRAISPAKRN